MATLRLSLAALIIALWLALTGVQAQYGYSTWAHFHYPGSPCTLAQSATCQETGNLPTMDQRIAWSSYLYFVSCYQNNNERACSALEN